MRYLLAADPGLSGAIAILDIVENTLTVHPTPTFEVPVVIKGKKKTRREIDLVALREMLSFKSEEVIGAFLEKVTARPTDSCVAAFRFAECFKAIETAFVMKSYPTHLVRPQVWKARFELIGEDKDASRGKASEFFPTCSELWKLKKEDGMAEAALICMFGVYALDLNVQLDLIRMGNILVKKVRKKMVAPVKL